MALTSNVGYRLAQKGFNDTNFNESWQSGNGWYDSTLVSFDDSSDPSNVILNFLTQDMNEVYTYDSNAILDADKTCDLWLGETLYCTQEFEVYVESWTGIIAVVGTLEVRFFSECY